MRAVNNLLNMNEQITLETFNEKHLKYIAYSGQSELIHSILKNAPVNFKETIRDKEILSQAISGSIKRIYELKSIHNYVLLESEKQFLLGLLNHFGTCCERKNEYPKEYFESVIYSSEVLIQLNDLDKATAFLESIIKLGINKYPKLLVELINKLSYILSKKGSIEESSKILQKLIYHPYFVTDRNQLPEIFNSFSQAVLKLGDLKLYKSVLFAGLKYFYTNHSSRKLIFDQIIRTYKNIFRIIISKEVTWFNKVTVFTHWLYYKTPDFSKIKLSALDKVLDAIMLATLYILNYIIKVSPIQGLNDFTAGTLRLTLPVNTVKCSIGATTNSEKRILITRAMGGIGDLLMMTPGLHALKQKHPKKEIHLAIPRRYFPVFENNPDVNLIDIEEDFFAHSEFSKWHNLTDCPASRKESLTAPKVKKNRIEIFAKDLGIKGIRLLKLYKRPRIFLSENEKEFSNEFWSKRELSDKKVIGIQLHSDESYRDFPNMDLLVEKLSNVFTVLIFDISPINGFDYENVIKIHSLSLRKVFALIQKCDAVVAPDSSFVHIAAAFDIPTLGLFGPIDGKLRTGDYPNCRYLDVRDELKCLPCWRNENIPCKLTGLRNSICMESISVNKIFNEVKQMV